MTDLKAMPAATTEEEGSDRRKKKIRTRPVWMLRCPSFRSPLNLKADAGLGLRKEYGGASRILPHYVEVAAVFSTQRSQINMTTRQCIC